MIELSNKGIKNSHYNCILYPAIIRDREGHLLLYLHMGKRREGWRKEDGREDRNREERDGGRKEK